MIEIWKDVDGYEGSYLVSNYGRIKSVARKIPYGIGFRTTNEVIRKLKLKNNGYRFIQLSKNGVSKCFYIHRLVAFAFCYGYFEKADVNHKDGNKSNNNAANLEWCSRSENQIHAYQKLKRGCYSKGRFGKDSPRSIPIIQFSLCGDIIRKWSCAAEAQRELNIQESSIRRCLYGNANSAGGYKWEYSHYKKKLKEIEQIKQI